jgi:AcrR family transcriptional regulator
MTDHDPAEPAWWTPRKPMRRHGLSRAAIIEAGLRVVRKEGLDALSMRRIATELDTGPASLYAHVANKDELLELLFDEVAGEIPLPEPDPARWREQLTQLWIDSHATMLRYGDIARFAIGHIPVGPNSMRLSDLTMALLRAGGVPDRAVAWAVDVVGGFVTFRAVEDATREDAAKDPAFYRRYQEYFAGLPAGRFPVTAALADQLTTGDEMERFRFGLELLVGGLAALAVAPGE